MDENEYITILVIEDDTTLRLSMCDFLEDQGYETLAAENGQEGIDLYDQEHPDLILTDLRMPVMSGIEVLRYIRNQSSETPLIVVSGGGEITDVVEALKLGAWDYILKPISDMSIVLHAVKQACEKSRLQKENLAYHTNLEEMLGERTKELQTAKDHQQRIIDGILDMLVVVDRDHSIVMMNAAAEKVFPAKELPQCLKKLQIFEETGGACETSVTEVFLPDTGTNENTPYEVVATPLFDDSGAIQEVIYLMRNITERKEMEKEQNKLQQILHQTEKNEAIGQLAGGVAHDFNNMLGCIMGSAELLKCEIPETVINGQKFVDIIYKSTKRAADLTSKLLAFGRKQQIYFKTIDINDVINETLQLLNKVVNKQIVIESQLTTEETSVIGDSSLLQSVILNLGINASHAMPDGGSLTYSTKRVELLQTTPPNNRLSLPEGSYIEIKVSDTGSGISPDILPRIFEPFFTTKEQGKGTGLGLAASHGTIKQHKGEILVDSEVGTGTCFSIYLPLSEGIIEEDQISEAITRGHGQILLVDDEKTVRLVSKAILNDLGYEVILAENGEEAIEIYRENIDSIDLVMLDMIMPVMNGSECLEALWKINPSVKAILSSGFSYDQNLNSLKNKGFAGFIQKPFSSEKLGELIANTLE